MEQLNGHRMWHEDGTSLSRRVLTTLLFTDVVDSTERVVRLGDRAWAQLLEAHLGRVREQLDRLGGREVDATGDGLLAAFDTPSLAVRCASSIGYRARELSLEVRSGVHTGECEVLNGRYRGLAVHVGARVVALARPGDVLVTDTVRDLMAGADVGLEDRGMHQLRGVPEPRRLFAVVAGDAARNGSRVRDRSSAVRVTHPRTPDSTAPLV